MKHGLALVQLLHRGAPSGQILGQHVRGSARQLRFSKASNLAIDLSDVADELAQVNGGRIRSGCIFYPQSASSFFTTPERFGAGTL